MCIKAVCVTYVFFWSDSSALPSPVPQSKGLITRSTHVQEQKKLAVQPQAEWVNSLRLCLFVLFRLSMDWEVPTFTGEDIFTQSANSNPNVHLTLTETHRNNLLPPIRASLSPVKAHGGSQARHLIGATTAGLCHSHSKARSESHLRSTPQLTATLGP